MTLQPGQSQQVQDAYGQANQGFGNQLDGGFAAGLQGQVGPNSYTDAMKGMMQRTRRGCNSSLWAT